MATPIVGSDATFAVADEDLKMIRTRPSGARGRCTQTAGAILVAILVTSGSSSAASAQSTETAPDSDSSSAPREGPAPLKVGTMQRFSIPSEALAATVRYRLLVTAAPLSGQRLDLLLLIHGANANEDQWDDVAIDDALLRRSRQRELAPTLLLLPDGDSAGLDAPGDAPFARFLLEELLPHVQREFPVTSRRARRAIGGISRGGRWALTIAAAHPEQFGTVGGHSPVVPSGVAGRDVAVVFAAHQTRVWLDVGDSDALRESVLAFAVQLRAAHAALRIDHHVGAHDRVYWRAQSNAYAAFYGRG